MNVGRGPSDGAVDALLGQQNQALHIVSLTERQKRRALAGKVGQCHKLVKGGCQVNRG